MSEKTAVFEEKMKKTISNLESEYSTIRAGRANPHVLDRIMVDYYGTPTPINKLAIFPFRKQGLFRYSHMTHLCLKRLKKQLIHPNWV